MDFLKLEPLKAFKIGPVPHLEKVTDHQRHHIENNEAFPAPSLLGPPMALRFAASVSPCLSTFCCFKITEPTINEKT